MNVAIIPARGGSKRIPRKNIKLFKGKPMLSYSIEAAIKSGCFDRVIVSTDDAEISKVAIDMGAEVPFVRPPNLSDDHTATVPVIKHAIEYINTNGGCVDLACCIYATAPFVQAKDLEQAFEKISNSNSHYCLSVTTFPYPIQRALRIVDSGSIAMIKPENYDVRSQDLEEAYHDAGQFYFGTAQAWLEGLPILADKSLPLIIPRCRAQDIDTQEDWEQAELMYEVLNR